MRRGFIGAVVLGLGLVLVVAWPSTVSAQRSVCDNIQSGLITSSTGETLTPGYDELGYNYQAHIYNGDYCDYDREPGGAHCDVDLQMKWSDEWLSNLDCDDGEGGEPDGKLDRGLDSNTLTSDGTSQGWLTNHQSGVYIDGESGRKCNWTYFVKIVYVGPAPTDGSSDPWAGYRIWGSYARIQAVYNDQCDGYHGVEFKPIVAPGFGLDYSE